MANRLRGDGWVENEPGEFLVAYDDGTPVIRDGCADQCADPTRLGDIVEALVKQRDQLRAALKEALAGWAREWGQHEHHGGPIAVPPRMLELQKLVEP